MKARKKSAVAYLFRNFWQIVPFAAIPAVLFGYCAMLGLRLDITVNLAVASDAGLPYDMLYDRFLSPLASKWWVLLIACAALMFALSLIVAKVEMHMRYGVLDNARLLGTAVRSIGRFAGFSAMMLSFYIVLNMLVYGINYFIAPLMPKTALIVEVSVFCAAVRAVVVLLLARTLCTLPAVQSDDYRLNVAISYSIRLAESKKRAVAFPLLATGLLLRAAMVALSIFVANRWIQFAAFSLYYLWWFSFYPVYCCEVYEDFSEGDRRDLPQYAFWMR